MDLPEQLQKTLAKELSTILPKQLKAASEELSIRYRNPKSNSSFMTSGIHRLAYLAARMPATFAAVNAVFKELLIRQPTIEINSMLDFGCGPATALWAAMEHLHNLKSATLIEQDSDLIAIAKRLLEGSNSPTIAWRNHPMQQINELQMHDLISFSYSLNELKENERVNVLEGAWKLTNKILMIIEPGTPVGFENIRKMRAWLVEAGAHLVAPCPSHLPCPMSNGNWCHFAARLERSAEHRAAKGVTMGYEDEKYSYVIASKTPCSLPQARLLMPSQKRSGHMLLNVCTDGTIVNKTVSRRDGDLYKQAKKLEWGDAY